MLAGQCRKGKLLGDTPKDTHIIENGSRTHSDSMTNPPTSTDIIKELNNAFTSEMKEMSFGGTVAPDQLKVST